VGEPGEQIWGDDQPVKIGGQPLAGLGSLLGQVTGAWVDTEFGPAQRIHLDIATAVRAHAPADPS
jgi:hypothetical protein